MNLEPIDQVANRLREESQTTIQRIHEQLAEDVRQLDLNRAVLPLLVQDGFVVPYDGMTGLYLWIDLGDMPSRGSAKAEFLARFRQLRDIFGAGLEKQHHYPVKIATRCGENSKGGRKPPEEKRLKYILKPKGCRNVQITFTTRLPKTKKGGGKPRCKIVTRLHRELVLVCEK